jgi:hypothetical protein
MLYNLYSPCSLFSGKGGVFSPDGEMFMTRYAILFAILFLLITLLVPQVTMSQNAGPTIVNFGARPLYRAAKLTWKVIPNLEKQLSVQILRADTEAGPYTELDVVTLVPGKDSYEYIDKSMGTESKYYYKAVIKETGESFGPDDVRPLFSPPATQFHPPKQIDSVLALR